jgi:hypothetical protein
MLEIDLPNLAIIFLFSVLGMAYFVYGKKQSNFPFMISGIALMFYGYFTEPVWVSLVVGLAIAAFPQIAKRL